MRKVLLFKYSYAFVVLPGGLGTLDELTEALTLIQTGKIQDFPVVLIGTAYWQPFLALLREMIAHGAVAPHDLDLLKVTDDLDEAMAPPRDRRRRRVRPEAVPWRAEVVARRARSHPPDWRSNSSAAPTAESHASA